MFLHPLHFCCCSPAFLAVGKGWLVIGLLQGCGILLYILPDSAVPLISVFAWYCVLVPLDLLRSFIWPLDWLWLSPHWRHGWPIETGKEYLDDCMICEHGPVELDVRDVWHYLR